MKGGREQELSSAIRILRLQEFFVGKSFFIEKYSKVSKSFIVDVVEYIQHIQLHYYKSQNAKKQKIVNKTEQYNTYKHYYILVNRYILLENKEIIIIQLQLRKNTKWYT